MAWFYLALISAVFSALAAVGEKKVLFKLDALDFSFLVSIVTLLFSAPFFLDAPLDTKLSLPLIILFIKVTLSAIAFLCVMLAIKKLEISEALPLLALSPALVAVFGALLIRDALAYHEWIGLSLMVAGTYILEQRDNGKSIFFPFQSLLSMNKYKYVFCALALFSVTSLCDRILLKDLKLPANTFMAYQQLFFAVIFTAWVTIRKRIADLFQSIDRNTVSLVVLISMFTVVYRYTQIEATKLSAVALVLSVKRLSILMAIILGGTLFKEDRILKRAMATCIILAGLIFLLKA